MSNICEGCGGACCHNQESPPGLVGYLPGASFEHEDCDDARRVREMPEELRRGLIRYKNRLLAGLKPYHPQYPTCLWLDKATGKCKHYRWRPDVCREFKAGGKDCRRIKAEFATMTVRGAHTA